MEKKQILVSLAVLVLFVGFTSWLTNKYVETKLAHSAVQAANSNLDKSINSTSNQISNISATDKSDNTIKINSITIQNRFDSDWSVFYKHSFTPSFFNNSDSQIDPTISTKIISPIFGTISKTSNQKIGTILPGQSLNYKFSPDSTLYFGPYVLTIFANIEGSDQIQKTITLWVIPWKFCLIIAVFILGLISVLYLDDYQDPIKKTTIRQKK